VERPSGCSGMSGCNIRFDARLKTLSGAGDCQEFFELLALKLAVCGASANALTQRSTFLNYRQCNSIRHLICGCFKQLPSSIKVASWGYI
jgi:hypothetical protein